MLVLLVSQSTEIIYIIMLTSYRSLKYIVGLIPRNVVVGTKSRGRSGSRLIVWHWNRETRVLAVREQFFRMVKKVESDE